MKTLEKLKLHNLEEICVQEQKNMLGGSGSEPIYGSGTQLQEVICYGYSAPATPFVSYYDPYYAGYVPSSNNTTYGSSSSSGGNSGGGGGSTLSTNSATDFVTSYGIPDSGIGSSYTVLANTSLDSNLMLNVTVNTTLTDTSITGCIKLYVNGEFIESKNLIVPNSYFISQGEIPVGSNSFDLASYSGTAPIYVIIMTQQVAIANGGNVPNILGPSETKINIR